MVDKIVLNNGIEMPQYGLGCGGIYSKKELFSKDSIDLYKVYNKCIRGSETLVYDSESVGWHEKLLGASIKKGKRRDNMFVVTKLSNSQQREGNVKRALEKSLSRLGTDYVDLYLMHWPQTDTFIESYQQMEEVYKMGLAKAIGVCNFHQHHLNKLMQSATVVPAVNQIEMHPLFNQEELLKFCKDMKICVMAYTPLGRMHDVLINSRVLRELSKKYDKTIPQIIIRWHIQRGVCPIPKTTKYYRVKQYIDTFEFALSNDEMSAINEINDNVRLRYNPDKCDFSRL